VTIETDASDSVSAVVLSQHDDDRVLHPIAYFSKKHILAEWKYDIHDAQCIANLKALEKWRPECKAAAYPLQLLTDHINLKYCIDQEDAQSKGATIVQVVYPFCLLNCV
jgi:hypothetical protein